MADFEDHNNRKVKKKRTVNKTQQQSNINNTEHFVILNSTAGIRRY